MPISMALNAYFAPLVFMFTIQFFGPFAFGAFLIPTILTAALAPHHRVIVVLVHSVIWIVITGVVFRGSEFEGSLLADLANRLGAVAPISALAIIVAYLMDRYTRGIEAEREAYS